MLHKYGLIKTEGFNAHLKLFPSDFKVIEIDKNGIPCYKEGEELPLFAPEEEEKSKNVKSSTTNEEPCSKKQLLESDESGNGETTSETVIKQEKKDGDFISSMGSEESSNAFNASHSKSASNQPLSGISIKHEDSAQPSNCPVENQVPLEDGDKMDMAESSSSKDRHPDADIETDFIVNEANCKSKLASLLPAEKLEFLKSYHHKKIDYTTFEPYSLGHFKNKDIRAVLYKCIRYLYTNLSTAADKHEIHVKPSSEYKFFRRLLGQYQTIVLIRYACIPECDNRPCLILEGSGEWNKTQRQAIHRGIQRYFGWCVTSKTVDQGKNIEVQRKPKKRRIPEPECYCKFLLHKTNVEASDAANILATCMFSKPNLFTVAGTKDRRAETWQWMSVRGKALQDFEDINELLPQYMRVSKVHVVKGPLCFGDLHGNAFQIILREVTPKTESGSKPMDMDTLKKSVEAWMEEFKEHGFVNYYGRQRLGRHCTDVTGRSDFFETAAVGQAILRRNWKYALEVFLRPSVSNDISDEEVEALSKDEQAKLHLYRTGSVQGTLKKIENQNVRLLAILRTFLRFARNIRDLGFGFPVPPPAEDDPDAKPQKIRPDGYIKKACAAALTSIQRNGLAFYVYAYSNLVWNKAAEERLRKFGESVVEGDLVVKHSIKNEPIVVTAADVENKTYKMNQVVIPLIGHSAVFPPNIKEFYLDTLKADGIIGDDENLNVFRISQVHLNIRGSLRRLVEYPRKLTYSWSTEKPPPASSSTDDIVNLHLNFELTTGTYATTFLQELSQHGLKEEKP